jgi:hypothetical protein
MNHIVIAAALAELEEQARTEIIRVRTTPKQKEQFAQCSAALGLPSATHAYKLMMNAVHAHVRRRASHRTGAARRPVLRGAMRPSRV